MRTPLLLSLAALALLALGGCSDSATDPGTGPGGNYQPTGVGSTWHYTGARTYTVTMEKDTVIGGKTYQIFYNTEGVRGLLLIDNGVYTQWQGTSLTSLNLLYIKESEPVGGSWTFQMLTSYYEYSVAAIGITHTVNGVTYNNVLKMHLKTMVPNPITGQLILYNEGDYYYAKGVGFIESDLGTLGRIYLVNYDLK